MSIPYQLGSIPVNLRIQYGQAYLLLGESGCLPIPGTGVLTTHGGAIVIVLVRVIMVPTLVQHSWRTQSEILHEFDETDRALSQQVEAKASHSRRLVLAVSHSIQAEVCPLRTVATTGLTALELALVVRKPGGYLRFGRGQGYHGAAEFALRRCLDVSVSGCPCSIIVTDSEVPEYLVALESLEQL